MSETSAAAVYARPELLQVADTVARDKGIDREEVLQAMEQAIQKAGKKDRKAVLHAMREFPSFQGVTGEVVFDKKGDNEKQFIGVFKAENGKLVYVGPA